MTEDPSELNLCPVCGMDNLPMATRCVHCGADMESLFTISGQPQLPDEGREDSLPDIIEEIRNDPALQTPKEIEPKPEEQSAEQIEQSELDGDQLPDWLAKVRERAQEEEGAIGDLASSVIAMDAARSEDASSGVEGEFTAWINRIREKSQQETSIRARQLPKEREDPDQVPEWLQRIRALRPQPEEEVTHEVNTGAPYLDGLPREWTDEALDELRRQALAEELEQETELISASNPQGEEEELSTEPDTENPGKILEEGPGLIEEDFHNIPDDEDENRELLPEQGQTQPPDTQEKIVETEAVQTAEEELESNLEETLEEPAEDLSEPGESHPDETGPREDQPEEIGLEIDSAGPEENEISEQIESESAAIEDKTKPAPGGIETEPEDEQPADSAAVPPDLLLLRDQQDRASLLASLIEEEGRVTAGTRATRKPSGIAGRLAVALLLLIGLIVSILIGPAPLPADTPKSIPALALSDQIETLSEASKVLVVLDYQAATSRELEALAAPLLQQMHSQGTQITVLTTQPSGLFLAQSLFVSAGLPEETKVEYLPGSYLSLVSWAINPAVSRDLNPVKADNLLQVKNLEFFHMILLVSDSSDNIRGWLEQIAPWVGSSNFAAVTTQTEAPILLPYFDSDQLVGYAAGIADSNLGAQATFNHRAYQVGLLLMLVMLLLGMISKAETDAIRREEERAE